MTLFIVVGTISVAYVLYTAVYGAVYDPTLPHEFLWRTLFGTR